LLLGIDEKIIDHISKEDPLHQGKYNMTIIWYQGKYNMTI
jgi:hypothetical protein